MVREAPLNDIHLENMLKLSRMGVVINPPVPAFYNHPQSVDELVSHIVMRALDQFGLHTDVIDPMGWRDEEISISNTCVFVVGKCT